VDALAELVGTFLATRPAGEAVSVWLAGLDGREVAALDADRAHYAASTMKLPLLVAALRRHEEGTLDLDAPLPVHNEFASALDGSAYHLEQEEDQDDETWEQIGAAVPLRVLARRSIVRSGNLATNLVLERVGTAALADVLADSGCSTATVLPRGIGDYAARDAGLDNFVTAHDLGLVMLAVANDEGPVGRQGELVLSRQEHRDKIPAGLPAGTYVANKTGWISTVSHDVALVRPENAPAYVLAVCTTTAVPEDDASALVAAVSRAVWQGWAA